MPLPLTRWDYRFVLHLAKVVCVYMHVYMCMHMHVEVRGQHWNPSLVTLHLTVGGRGLSLNLEFTECVDWLVSTLHGSDVLCPPLLC